MSEPVPEGRIEKFSSDKKGQLNASMMMQDAPEGSIGFRINVKENIMAVEQLGAGYIILDTPAMCRMVAKNLNDMADEWDSGELGLKGVE